MGADKEKVARGVPLPTVPRNVSANRQASAFLTRVLMTYADFFFFFSTQLEHKRRGGGKSHTLNRADNWKGLFLFLALISSPKSGAVVVVVPLLPTDPRLWSTNRHTTEGAY